MENIDEVSEAAPLGAKLRLGSVAADILLLKAVSWAVFTAFAIVEPVSCGLLRPLLFAAAPLYFIISSYIKWGTPGQLFAGGELVKEDGGPPGLRESLVRNGVFFVTAPLFPVSLAMLFFSKHGRLFHDTASKTVIVARSEPEVWRKRVCLVALLIVGCSVVFRAALAFADAVNAVALVKELPGSY